MSRTHDAAHRGWCGAFLVILILCLSVFVKTKVDRGREVSEVPGSGTGGPLG